MEVEIFEASPDNGGRPAQKFVKIATDNGDKCSGMKLYLSIDEARALVTKLGELLAMEGKT